MAHTRAMTVGAAVTSPVHDSLIGTRLNGFVITGVVSAGGMGVVYEARHPLIGRRAAVKVVRPELCGHADLDARFLREAQAVSAVKHKNVVEILDFGALPDGAQYMMMEFLEGDTLAQVIARDAPMRPLAALHICEEIVSGLSAAHQVGVVHRDLKPANIVLLRQSSDELSVKVLDFGLARLLDTAPEPATRESVHELSSQKSSLLAGTPEYISPEQASGDQVGAQGDLYAVGVMLYEMLSGRLPFRSASPWELMQLHRVAPPPRLSSLLAGVEPLLDDLVTQLLEKDPAERPLGAREVGRRLAALTELLSHRQLADTVVLARASHLSRRRFTARTLAGATLAALLVAAAWGLWPAAASDPGEPEVPRSEASAIHLTPALAPAPPPAPTLVTVVAPAPVTAPRVAPRPMVSRTSSASARCEPTPEWKRAMREQLDDVEKLSLARMSDDAPPMAVAAVRLKARGLSTAARNAEGQQCQQVEAELRSWRTALR